MSGFTWGIGLTFEGVDPILLVTLNLAPGLTANLSVLISPSTIGVSLT